MTDTSQSIYEQVTQADRDRARRILAGEEIYADTRFASEPVWWLGVLSSHLDDYVRAAGFPAIRDGRAERARLVYAVIEQLVARREVTR
jgi:hypothetical protein